MLAADVGGLREAMCGVDYVLPVNPIVRYESKVSDQMVPEAEVPPQDLGPWIKALAGLLNSQATWEELSARSREAALAYLGGLTVKPLETILRKSLAHKRHRSKNTIEALSPIKRKLLALRIAKLQAEKRNRAFPVQWGEGLKVFLFPWAAAGVQAWNFLRAEGGFTYIPALLPGREDRMNETPASNFDQLVSALARELTGLLKPGGLPLGGTLDGRRAGF